MDQKRTVRFAVALLVVALAFVGVSVRILADTATTTLTVGIAQCSDGLDNDGDTLIDFPADPGCSSALDDDETDPPQGTPPGGGSGWYGGGPPPIGVPTAVPTTTPPGSGFEIFPPPPPPHSLPGKILRLCDFNGDNRCDIVDLSILLYYQHQTRPVPQAARYDLNNDGVIDIADISILLYYWG